MPPHMMAKLSGIGCSSKTPNYFLSKSHGFNSVHGRMPSIATGSNLANHELYYVGVSGDGDTASIGLGQFAHAVRRQVNMLYVVENNGTYGLTKGQLSATADVGMRSKTGEINPHDSIDLVSLALQLGASFVARGFSGDKDQLVPLIKAGFAHRGFALLDIISPCVTFNNHADSTKSFDYVREHNAIMNRPDFVPFQEEITVSYEAGESRNVTLHDGGVVRLHKLAEDYDPTDRVARPPPRAGAPDPGRDPDRAHLRGHRCARPPRADEHPGSPPQPPRRGGTLPGQREARRDQRPPSLTRRHPTKVSAPRNFAGRLHHKSERRRSQRIPVTNGPRNPPCTAGDGTRYSAGPERSSSLSAHSLSSPWSRTAASRRATS